MLFRSFHSDSGGPMSDEMLIFGLVTAYVAAHIIAIALASGLVSAALDAQKGI